MKKRLERMLPYLVWAACYALVVGLYAMYGMHNIDSDIASEMVLASLLNEEGGFLSPNWHYSTELRVISPVPVYQLGLMLFDSWHAARTFSIAVLLLGVAASFIYALRGMGMREGAVYAAAAVLLPVSRSYGFVFTYGGFYTVYVILACLLLGLVLRLPGRKPALPWLMELLLLSVLGGLSGVRLIMVCAAPLGLACAWAAFCALRGAKDLREAAALPESRMLLGAAVVAAGMLAGYVINSRVLSGAYRFQGYDDLRTVQLTIPALLDQLSDWFVLYGYRDGAPLLSMTGISCVLAVGLAGAILLAPALLLRDRTLPLPARMAPLFALCAVCFGLALNEMTGMGEGVYHIAYYILGVLLSVASLFMLLERLDVRWPGLRRFASLAVVAVFLLQARSTYGNEWTTAPAFYEDAADYLTENGYENGFATFWYGNVLTEASDGALNVYVLESWTEDELYPWLQRTAHLEALPEGPVFVYVGYAELEEGPVPLARDAHLAAALDNGVIYVYDSAQMVMDIQRAQ